jgi:chromosome segregation ATPase
LLLPLLISGLSGGEPDKANESPTPGKRYLDRLEDKLERLQERCDELEQQVKELRKQRDDAMQQQEEAKRKAENLRSEEKTDREQAAAVKSELRAVREDTQERIRPVHAQHQNEREYESGRTNEQLTAAQQRGAAALQTQRQITQVQIEKLQEELAVARHESAKSAELCHHAEKELEDTLANTTAGRKESLYYYSQAHEDLAKGEYAGAVKNLTLAVELYPYDARYFYLRGVARQRIGDAAALHDAEGDAERAAHLEKEAQPDAGIVDRALERIQGKTRYWIERHRPPRT